MHRVLKQYSHLLDYWQCVYFEVEQKMERKVLTWVLALSTLLFLATGIASGQGVLKIDEDRSYVLNLNTGTKTCYADFLNTDQFEGDELEFRIYVSKTRVPIPDDYVLELRTNMDKPRDWKFADDIYHSSSVVVWVGKAEHEYPFPSPIILTGVVPEPITSVKEPGFEAYSIDGIGKGRVYVELTVGMSRNGVTLETIQQKLSPSMVFYSTDRGIQAAERAITDNLGSARAKIGDTDLERDIRLLYGGGHPGWASILSKDYKKLSAMVGALSTAYPLPSVTPDQLFLATGTAYSGCAKD
jgi:hypothetical protein